MNIFEHYGAHRHDARVGNYAPLPLERFIALVKVWLA